MKSRYQIGNWVEVTSTVAFVIDVNNRRKPVRKTLSKSFTAQIVGAVNRQIGIYHRAKYDPYNEGDAPYLECKGTVLVWLVRRGITNRQIEVLPEDLKLCKKKDYTKLLPWRFQRSQGGENNGNDAKRVI